MNNHIIFFSGGKSSFSVADYVKVNYPDDNILLYFTDTLWEDEDLYRFIYEASEKLKLPMLIHSRGITPAQLMVQQKFMANNRVGTCSKELKMKVSANYFKKGIVPEVEKWHNKHFLKDEDFVTEPTLYFGIDWTEMHREEPIRFNWQPFKVEMPLIENMIDNDEILKKHDIKQPRLYDMEFAHNNCKAKCVKAGQAHFLNLLKKDSKTFYELMEQEIVISDYIRYAKQTSQRKKLVDDHLYKEVYEFVSTGKKTTKIQRIINTHKYTKKHWIGVNGKDEDIKKHYTFMKSLSLEELEQRPLQIDLFDFGGCGCFVDYEKE